MVIEVNAKTVAMAMLMAYDKAPTVEDGLANATRLLADTFFPSEPEPEWWEPVKGYMYRSSMRSCLAAIACELENG